MQIARCFVLLLASSHAFRVSRMSRTHQTRRVNAEHSYNSTAASLLKGFYNHGRWRDLFRQDLRPEQIGKGTFGAAMKVTLAPICRASEQVVVKRIALDAGNGVDSKMLNNELQIQQAISDHPNLVGLYDYHPQDPRQWPKEKSVYVMMPLADGGNVDRAYWQEVEKSGIKHGIIQNYWEYVQSGWTDDSQHEADHRQRNTLVSRIAHDIYAGLAYMHELGYVHRDLKPQNIWASHKSCMTKYAASCKYMIGDFGISAPAATASREVCGTGPYMPPEIPTGGGHGHYTYSYPCRKIGWSKAGDVYALGLTLLSILTGHDAPSYNLGGQLFDIAKWARKNLLGLGEHLTSLLEGTLHPEPGRRITAKDALAIAKRAYLAASGRQPPTLPKAQKPLCVQECLRMSCCYNLRCAVFEGKCDDGMDPSQNSGGPALGLWDAGVAVVNLVRGGFGWMEEDGEDKPLGPVPPKVLPTGKFCYGQDEIPAGERVLPGVLIPQKSVERLPSPTDEASKQAPKGQAPEPPAPPRLEMVPGGEHTLSVTWEIPAATPPVGSISVGIRQVGGGVFVVDATDGKNVLVAQGGQPVRAPTTSIRFNVQPGQSYVAMISMRNAIGPSQYSQASAPVAVPAPAKLPPPPPPPLATAPQPELVLAGATKLHISWTIPETTPPVESISVALRYSGGGVLVDTTGGQISLVAKGGSPVRAPTTSIDVNVQAGETYTAFISLGNSVTMTSWSQASASVAVPAPQLQQSVGFTKGMPVYYFSATAQAWIEAEVIEVDARGVQVDVKAGYPIPLQELAQKLKQRLKPQHVYQPGHLVWYYSVSTASWLPATVISVDDQGGVECDVKPGHPVPLDKVAEKLKLRQEEPIAQPVRQQPSIAVGQAVSYYSTSGGNWVPARVTEVDPVKGVEVDVKPGGHVPWELVAEKIKPRAEDVQQDRARTPAVVPSARVLQTPAQSGRVSRTPRPGQASASTYFSQGAKISYYSESQTSWLPGVVTKTDGAGIEVEVQGLGKRLVTVGDLRKLQLRQ